MKYISLLNVAGSYGFEIRDRKDFYQIRTNRRPASLMFDIRTTSDAKTGQIQKNITINDAMRSIIEAQPYDNKGYVGVLPPIMEIEYMRQVLPFEDSIFDVLEQMAYFYIIMTTLIKNGYWQRGGHWEELINTSESVMELEDVNDAVRVMELQTLANIKAHKNINPHKIPSWSTAIFYSPYFVDLFFLCEGQISTKIMEFYYHMPVLLSIFLVDYDCFKLKNWDKSYRLRLVNEMEERNAEFADYHVIPTDSFSYGTTATVTRGDVRFIHIIFTYIIDKIKDINTDMGTIVFKTYKRVSGPDRIRASVMLTEMNLDWEDELERAEEEGKLERSEN